MLHGPVRDPAQTHSTCCKSVIQCALYMSLLITSCFVQALQRLMTGLLWTWILIVWPQALK